MQESSLVLAPVVEKIPKKFKEHGHERVDNYFWLLDKTNPKVIQHLKDENEYCAKILEHTKPLQDSLFKELKARIKEVDVDVPVLDNGYFYTKETQQGKEYPIYLRTKNNPGSEKEILLDGNLLSKGQETFLLDSYEVSKDNNLLAYASNYTGSYMEYTLQFLDLEKKIKLKDEIKKVDSYVWANDNKSILYTVCNEALRPYRVYKHLLGTSVKEDELIYEEKDELFNLQISKDKNNKFIIIHSVSFTSSESLLIPADNAQEKPKIFFPRTKDVMYSIETHDNGYYILYKDEENINYKILLAPLLGYGDRKLWKEVIPHNSLTKLEEINCYEKYLAITYRKNGLSGIKVLDLKKGTLQEVIFTEPVYGIQTLDNPEYDSYTIRSIYSSLNRPASVYDFDMEKNVSIKLKEQEIPSGFNPEDYVVERIFATAADGIKVPIAMVYKKALVKNGNNPFFLSGYGSYGITYDADFNRNWMSLVDRGFICGIAQIRGGSDLGENWYEDGKLFKKKNTFTDFIACVEFLIQQKYTNPDLLTIQGRSAGGLLMGAVTNMRPDLFKAAIAGVPFVDIMNTMLDATLPLTTQEYEQWGNPNEMEAYEYMLSYSPYDNIKKAAYPSVLATTGLNDSQVGYHEAAKWIAKLREYNTGKNTLLLKTNLTSGHGGSTGRFDHLKEVAFEYAFLLNAVGLVKK